MVKLGVVVRGAVKKGVVKLGSLVGGIYARYVGRATVFPLFNDLYDRTKTIPITLSRNSASIYKLATGYYAKVLTDIAAHTGTGTRIDPVITNANTNYNLNPTDTTNITDSNATTTVIAPSEYPAKLQKLADDGDANGNVYRTEASAAAGSAFVAGNPANTNPRSLFVIARAVVGSGKLALGSAGAPVASVNITSSEWQIYKIDGATPSASGNPLRMVCDADGDIIEWIANQTTETAVAPEVLVECAGSSGTQALTDAQVPCFADNYVDYSEDFSQWIEADGGSYNASTGELTFTTNAISRIAATEAINAVVAGETYTIFLRAKAGTKSNCRVGRFDSVGFSYSTALDLTSEFEWYSFEVTYGAGATNKNVLILNNNTTAGSIFIDKCIVSTSPILPKYLETTGSPKIYEMGNMVTYSEEVGGTGWGTAGTGVVTLNNSIAPDGRLSVSLLEDTDATVAFHKTALVTVPDDSEKRMVCSFIRKSNSPVSIYPCVQGRYQTGGVTYTANVVVDNYTGSYNATSQAEDIEVIDEGSFYRVVFGVTNNASGNTEFRTACFPAFNSDGSSSNDVTTTGSNEFWGAQIIDYDVDTDQYCPTWGSARKLRYNQIWENRSWIYLKVQDYIDGAGFPAIFSSEIDDNNRITIVVNNPANTYFLRKVAGVNDNININQYPETGDDIEVLIQSEPTGEATFTININGTEYENTDPDPDDWLLGDIIQLGCRPVLTNYAIGKYSNFKWGVLPAGGITLEQAKRE